MFRLTLRDASFSVVEAKGLTNSGKALGIVWIFAHGRSLGLSDFPSGLRLSGKSETHGFQDHILNVFRSPLMIDLQMEDCQIVMIFSYFFMKIQGKSCSRLGTTDFF